MATWRELVTFIRQSYRVIRDEPEELRIRLRFRKDPEDEERTQMVVIAREVLDKREEWVQIATPFARADECDLHAVLEEIGHTTVVGGACVMGEYLVLRHSLPLKNLDINEFTDPLELVTGSAEMLEEQITGRDDY
ncbi:hypothetical protein FHX82_004183 [Amycolatopsis bartoniae]|uniref:Uncharacterized protein n=1 Tax=Amycolatopsis bartoniae TaxID=941986 RepID=A0A8H9IRY9_9PSEU|nr:hypothetical protein [Amycolatopsis bartoniae]MBB2937119.1 hypothetical protein [Amycolatopsis bartoniae]TVT05994.1 hypothetical protein FNH07_21630 [Amycolatopsis bartoniae]GHF52560.1 hypothetical protein GCM10017566_27420 [Amycolatopsis bartoniae]